MGPQGPRVLSALASMAYLARILLPAGSRRARAVWFALQAARKLGEGPRPFWRAVQAWMAQRSARRAVEVGPPPPAAAGCLPVGPVEVAGRVSVILPVYQQADTLAESIDSVLAQTYPDFELIVLDDGSAPEVGAVMRRYLGHPRVRLLRQPNQGLPKALSSAFEVADGEFFCWTSADNLMEPGQLDALVACLRARPTTAMVYADYTIIDDRGQPVLGGDFRVADRSGPDDARIRVNRETRFLNAVQDNFIGPCFCYRGAVGRLVGDYNPELGLEDYDYWMRINRLFGIRHLGTDQLLYRYRVHDNTLSARARELKIFERGQRLMAYERRRHDWHLATCCLAVDWASRRWVGPALATNERMVDVAHVVAESREGKGMAIVRGVSLGELAAPDRLPTNIAVVAWFDDVAHVYRAHTHLAHPQVIAFGATPAITARLGVFTRQAFTAPPGPALLEVARRFVADRTFMASTRQPDALFRALPRPLWRQRPRVLVQAATFTQGGMEGVVVDLVAGLRRLGADVSLLVFGQTGPDVDRARAAGARIVGFDGDRDPERYRRLLAEGFDVVNAHDSPEGAAVAASMGIPFVQTLHNTYVWFPPERQQAYRDADPHTSAYVAVSAQVLCYADLRLGLDRGKALVVPNGIDASRAVGTPTGGAHPLRRELGLRPEDVVFLNVASLYAPKAQRIAVRALAQTLPELPAARLVLLGRAMDPAYAATVQREAEDLGVAHAVAMAGYRPDPAPFYAMADVFLLPSYFEGCSLAVLEAVAAGLPLVLSDVGAAREQLAFGRGALVAPPFASIAEIDWSNLGPLVDAVQPDFVARTAAAMLAVARDRGQRRPHREWAMDRGQMADAYLRLFGWLRQGGGVPAAREWIRRGRDARFGPDGIGADAAGACW
jgi:glycosyltransferase involved in cell wall biosynthesis